MGGSARGRTQTMYQATVHQNALCAVLYYHKATGFKDRKDPCHRSRAYQSEAKGAFTPVDNTPLHFRTDGVPLNPCRLPGRPLMVPKRPNLEALVAACRRTAVHQRSSRIQIGDKSRTDPSRFQSTTSLFYRWPPRLLTQPNPLIAAETSKRLHCGLEFTHRSRS